MSVRVTSWVLEHSEEGVPGRRLVLLVLADKADHDGTNAYPSVARIAREARMSERGVRYALRALESSGRISKRGTHPMYGTTEYVVVMQEGGHSVPGGNLRQEGGQMTTENVRPIAPEPSLYPSPDPSSVKAHTAKRVAIDDQDQLRPAWQLRVIAELRRFADSKAASLDEPKALAACIDFPGRDFVGAAEKMAEWYTTGAGANAARSSTNATWRKWLGNEAPVTNGRADAPPADPPVARYSRED